jgi:hypothetical protein
MRYLVNKKNRRYFRCRFFTIHMGGSFYNSFAHFSNRVEIFGNLKKWEFSVFVEDVDFFVNRCKCGVERGKLC